jgi:ABC-2 type transport system ATP-binding protein
MPAIETHGLSKTYVSHKKKPGLSGALWGLFTREKTEVEAVKDISISIEQGELVGFLGPNGAGKTTTLKMLTGILHPTQGSAGVLGFNPSDRKPEMLKQISLVMGNKMQLWWDLPAWDSFLVLKELYEVPAEEFKKRTEFLLETLQLTDKVHIQVRKLSLGERMKAELVAALLHSPKVLFLDEPTIGLDVVSQKRIREFLLDLNKRDNCTVVLTSHYMQDVQELCDRIVVIDQGSLVFDGTLETLSDQFSDTRRLRLTLSESVEGSLLVQFGHVVSHQEGEVVLEVPRGRIASTAAEALNRLPVADLAIEEVDVEEVIRVLFTQGNVSRGTPASPQG